MCSDETQFSGPYWKNSNGTVTVSDCNFINAKFILIITQPFYVSKTYEIVYKKTNHLNCHVFCSRFMQFLESVGLLAIFSSFPRRASHLSMKHNLNVECEIPPMVRLYSNEKHDILNQKIPSEMEVAPRYNC